MRNLGIIRRTAIIISRLRHVFNRVCGAMHSSDLGKLAEVVHELLHTMGPTMSDEVLAGKLNVEIVDGKTGVIAGALKKKCF